MGCCLSVDNGGAPPKSRHLGWLESMEEEILSRVAGRLVESGSTRKASMFTQQGKKGTNQDAMVVWEDFNAVSGTTFCGVFDGHGPYGHCVAQRVRDILPLRLRDHMNTSNYRQNCSDSAENISRCKLSSVSLPNMALDDAPTLCHDGETKMSELDQKEKHVALLDRLRISFLKAFKVVDKELKLHQNIDCYCSGSTTVAILKQGQDLVIGNLGDSRAVLATRNQNGAIIPRQLTVDLKPNIPREAERIKRCNGRVFAHRDEPDVARIWLPHVDSPGLAMARAFGDFCLKDYGLISVPEITYRRITERDEFVVLATDGVWDVLSNREAVDLVASAPSQSAAARCLVESANRAWKVKYPTSKIDDCAVICLFLKADPAPTDPSSNDTISGNPVSPLCSPNRYINAQDSSPKFLSDNDNDAGQHDLNTHEPRDSVAGQGLDGAGWSALEGVCRANTLLILPVFSGSEKVKGT